MVSMWRNHLLAALVVSWAAHVAHIALVSLPGEIVFRGVQLLIIAEVTLNYYVISTLSPTRKETG